MKGHLALPAPPTTFGPVSAGLVTWRWEGQLYVTIIVKATFELVPANDMRVVAPEPLIRDEVPHDHELNRSVRLTSDLIPYLAQAEVVFTGHAHAPGGIPTTCMPVRLAVYRDRMLVDRTLHIHGDRVNGHEPVPFLSMPLRYERALGGVGWTPNPLGVGANTRRAILPNIVDPDAPDTTACFAPISRVWPARKSLLRGVSRQEIERPFAEIPEPFDWSYFQSAPPEQRFDALLGEEWLILEGLHPRYQRLRSRLPGVSAVAQIEVAGSASPAPHVLELSHADLLRIDGDAGRCSLSWRSLVPVQDEETLGAARIVAGLMVRGHPVLLPASEAVAEGVADHGDAPPEPDSRVSIAPTLRLRTAASAWPDLLRADEATSQRRETTARFKVDSQLRNAVASLQILERTMPLSPVDSDVARSRPAMPFEGAAAPSAEPAGPAAPLPGAPWSSLPAEAPPPIVGEETCWELEEDEPPGEAFQSPAPEAAAAASTPAESPAPARPAWVESPEAPVSSQPRPAVAPEPPRTPPRPRFSARPTVERSSLYNGFQERRDRKR